MAVRLSRCGHFLLLLAGVSAASCKSSSSSGGPAPTLMSPGGGNTGQPVSVEIQGNGGFRPQVHTDFVDPSGNLIVSKFSATLGTVQLLQVQLSDHGTLTAVVPDTLAPGYYDLTVKDPSGREGKLERAYHAVPPGEGALVSAFRVDSIAPQRAWQPFTIAVTAIDDQGRTVTSFNGSASVQGLSDGLVPSSIGPFSYGVWTGQVEVRQAVAADVLTVSDGSGHTGSSDPFAVDPAPAARVHVVGDSTPVMAGQCSPIVRLDLLDAFGLPTVATSPLALTVAPFPSAGAAANFKLYSNAGCTTEITGDVVVPKGVGSASVYYSAIRSGPLTLRASAASLDPSTLAISISPAPPTTLLFATVAQAVNAGACSQAAQVQAQDQYGNPSAPADSTLSLAAAPSAGFGLFLDATCTNPASGTVQMDGTGLATFYFRGTVAQVVHVTASKSGFTSQVQDELVTPEGSASRLAFVSAAVTVTAGACSGSISVQTQDSFGNPVASAGAVQVALAAVPSVTFYSDDACTTPASAIAIAPNRSIGSFTFKATTAGNTTVTASSTTLTAATQVERVNPAVPSKLVFVSGAQSLASNACSSAVTVQLQDAFANVTTSASPITIALGSSPSVPPDFTFYTDATCSTPATSIPVAAGVNSAQFWFKGKTAQTVSVSVSAPAATPPLGTTSQTETIRPATPVQLVYVTSPQTMAAGLCSGAVTVESRDASGNASPISTSGATTVSLSATPSTGFGFYSDATCTTSVGSASIAANASRTSFFFKGTSAAQFAVDATVAGWTAADQVETVTAATPSVLAFASAPQSLTAGGCSAQVQVESRDAYGNLAKPASNVAVGLSASPSNGFIFFSNAICTIPIASFSISSITGTGNFFFKGMAAATVSVTLASPGWTSASQSETISVAPPSKVVFVTAAQSVSVGDCSGIVTIESRDQYGNTSPVAAATAVALSSSASPATSFVFYSDPACGAASSITSATIPAGGTQASFYFSSTIATPVTITAQPSALTQATQVETINLQNSPTQLVFSTGAVSLDAGTCSSQVVLLAEDKWGNQYPVTGTTATLSASPSLGVFFYATAGCGGPTVSQVTFSSSSAGFWFRSTASGTVTFTASSGTLTPATQAETIRPAAPGQLVFTSSAQTLVSGACSSAAQLEVRDSYGNVSPVQSATAVSLSALPANLTFYSGSGCSGASVTSISVPSGQSTGTFSFKGVLASSPVVTASGAGIATPATQTETINPAPPDHLVITSTAKTVASQACSGAVTLQSRDPAGNASPVSADTTVNLSASPAAGVTFYAGGSCSGSAVTSTTISASSSAGTFSFKGTTAGSVTVTASVTGMSPSPTQVETINPAPPDHLVFTSSAQSLGAGACSGAITLESRDPAGNTSAVAAITTVTLAASPASGMTFYAGAGCTGGGVATVSLAASSSTVTFSFRGTTAGTVTLSATASGMSPAPTQDQTITAGSTTKFSWDAIPSPQGQSTPFPVTVRALDTYGNPTTSFVGTAALTASLAPMVCSSSCSNSTTSGAFLSGVWTGSVSVQSGATGTTLTATSGSITGTSGAFDVTGPANVAAPLAKLTASPLAVLLGSAINFDASGSTDYQDATAALQVSFDYSGTAGLPAGSGSWTAWSTTKTASNTYPAAGTYTPRVAVKDTQGNISYAVITVVVLPAAGGGGGGGTLFCMVSNSSTSDTGQSSCGGGGGGISFPAALRIAGSNGAQDMVISFSGPMTLSASYTYTLGSYNANLTIVAPPGVIIDNAFRVDVVNSPKTVTLAGLEFSRLQAPLTVSLSGRAVLQDLYIHDGPGVLAQSDTVAKRLKMVNCTGSCVHVTAGRLDLSGSQFTGSTGQTGVWLESCAGGAACTATYGSQPPLLTFTPVLTENVFTGFQNAVLSTSSCTGGHVVNNTFVTNATAVSGPGCNLINNIFFNQTTASVNCAPTGFANRRKHIAYLDASDACISADTGFQAVNPLFVFLAANDYRIQFTSPAKDAGADTWLSNSYWANFTGFSPGWFGAAYDIGGIETW